MSLLGAITWSPILIGLVTVVFLAICLIMVLTVLIQKPQGGGLSSAFGAGAGSGQTAFGTKTGDALTIFTIIVFVIYLGFAILLNYAARPQTLTVPATTATTPNGPADQVPAQPGDVPQPSTNPAKDPANPPVGPVTKPPPATGPAPEPKVPPETTPATNPNPATPTNPTPSPAPAPTSPAPSPAPTPTTPPGQ